MSIYRVYYVSSNTCNRSIIIEANSEKEAEIKAIREGVHKDSINGIVIEKE